MGRLGRSIACGLLGAAIGCAGPQSRPDGGKGLLPVGAPAPDLEGTTPDGGALRLSAVRGCAAVVYFYPRDGTPGCTKEACAIRDAWPEFNRTGVAVFGVSRQSRARHREFAAEHHLPFPLVADPSGEVQRAYGVPDAWLGFADARVSFLIDPAGRVSRIWPDVDPGVHARDVLAAARALTSGAAIPESCRRGGPGS